jgi:two-component system, response regulator / RNA-binding antiterminator
MESRRLSVAVIDANQVRAAILVEGLRAAGIEDVFVIGETAHLLKRLVDLNPDVVIIDLASPSRDTLDAMLQVSRVVERPVAMFVDQSDTAMIEAAVDAGVSAYIVDGLKKERVKPIVDMAISRFNAFARLQAELKAAKSELADRKVIEKAKGILMKQKGLNEAEAYALMRTKAMKDSIKLVDLAKSIVTAADLLG